MRFSGGAHEGEWIVVHYLQSNQENLKRNSKKIFLEKKYRNSKSGVLWWGACGGVGCGSLSKIK